MAEYARIEDGIIIERRQIDVMPPLKSHLWSPVVHEGTGELSNIVIEADRVRVIWSSVPIEQVKAALLKRVDEDAENVRLRHITPGDGMQMTYREKFEQAQGVNAMGETAANALTEQQRVAQFPTLSASIGLEGATLWDVAQVVLKKYAQFAQLSFVIERTRLSGKKSISDASSVEAATAAYEAIAWTTP